MINSSHRRNNSDNNVSSDFKSQVVERSLVSNENEEKIGFERQHRGGANLPWQWLSNKWDTGKERVKSGSWVSDLGNKMNDRVTHENME
jgi:hypothetical protein